ncbi:MAG: hypothetical protein KTV45_15005 [Acidimicrobiia bacterium]|nr:hypothetical protein [Acidimicrobiia bacterium]
MTETLRALTDVGYQLLREIAADKPSLFREDDSAHLKEEMNKRRQHLPEAETPLFTAGRLAQPQQSLQVLVENATKGPGRDHEHAAYLWHALPTVTAADMSDPRVLASINCFQVQGQYVETRWGLSNLSRSVDPKDAAKFVSSHWLRHDKASNTAARLWWLYEFSRRTAKYSEHSTDFLLRELAGHVNFYHRMLAHPYLMASDRIRATVVDVSLSNGLLRQNKTVATNDMLRALNRKAGAISLDVLSGDELRQRVEGVMPPKADASHHPPP